MDTETTSTECETKSPPPPKPPPPSQSSGKKDSSLDKDEIIERLQEEIRILRGKIRGYTTLSQICHEYREKSKRLEAELNQLKTSLDFQNFKILEEELAQVKELLDERIKELELCKRSSNMLLKETDTTDPDITQVDHGRNELASRRIEIDKTKTEYHGKDTDDTGKKNSSNKAEVVSPGEKLDLKSFNSDTSTSSKEKKPHNGTSVDSSKGDMTTMDPFKFYNREVTPMQESMTHRDNEPEPFQMVPRQWRESGSDSDDLILFSGVGASSKSITTLSRSQSSSKEALNIPVDELKVADFQNLDSNKAHSLCMKVSDSIISLRRVIHTMDEKIEQGDKFRKINDVLQEELQKKEIKVKELEAAIADLQKSLKSLTSESGSFSSETQLVSGTGWVKIQREQETLTQKDATEARIMQLQSQMQQLKDANQKWSNEWKKMVAQHEATIAEQQEEKILLQRDLAEFHIQDEQRKLEFDRMILDLKKRLEDAEMAKEDALNQLHAASLKADSMQAKMIEAEDRLDQLKRQKQSLETEISLLRSGSVYTQSQGSNSSPVLQKKASEVETENMVLRQQLMLFQEDFQKERHDRARAQSMKDDLAKENENLKKKIRHLDLRKIEMDSQLQHANDKSREITMERERLKAENYELQNKIRSIEMTNTQLRQQLQQQQQQREQYQAPIIQSAGLSPSQRMFQPYLNQQIYPGQHYQQQQQQHNAMWTPQQFVGNIGIPDWQQMNSSAYQQSQPTRVSPPMMQIYPGASGHELLPGAWNCPSCTYSNYPKRTVCEICGYIRSPSSIHGQSDRNQISGALIPRGDETQQQLYHHVGNNNMAGNGN
ncbi:hypothetical protein CHS0354_029840 [Potamilus streckersoni]|uniref:RanBP2-type domain-containing protein n=1 Tax=Potamilus streckersoni TaxID=2493646 RepID=A0AAE0TG57_9BIVA|nr:hypothetical protein CHS0354_029840 [Potamilus streckersoni]